MRIALISREYPPDTGYGGIATFVYHLAHGLHGLGHDVNVISLSVDRTYKTIEDGFMVHRVPALSRTESFACINTFLSNSAFAINHSLPLWNKFSELHLEKPFDVVDTPELLAEGLWYGLTRKAAQVVRLYTPHFRFIQDGLNNVEATLDHQIVALMERASILSADVVTAPSAELSSYIESDLGLSPGTVKVVKNPIDCQVFSPNGPVIDKYKNHKTVLFVGRLEQRKGIEDLVKAIPHITAQNQNLKFIIIGSDTNTSASAGSMLQHLKEILKKDGVSHLVDFIERVPLYELPAYYRTASLCVIPSIYDNSPYTCIESQACGTPVVGSSCGGIPEYILDGRTGLIARPSDPEDLARTITAALDNEQRLDEWSCKSREWITENFDRTKIARETIHCYEHAIDSFRNRQAFSLYKKTELEKDVFEFTGVLNEFVHNLLMDNSLKYRLAHMLNELRARPKLCMARALLSSIETLNRLISGPESTWSIVVKIRQAIARKQTIERI